MAGKKQSETPPNALKLDLYQNDLKRITFFTHRMVKRALFFVLYVLLP
jgi:hypothetical protein